MDKDQVRQHLSNWRDERDGVALYEALAAAEKNPRLAEIYIRFAEVEKRHAAAWEGRLREAGVAVPAFQPSFRTRALGFLARRLGVGVVLPTVGGMERAATAGYATQADAAEMVPEEASHARLLAAISNPPEGGMDGSTVAQLEGRHKSGGGNALRAAVLGANDGLVSNLSLVMGVAGAAFSSSADFAGNAILITGLAGLLAGSCSMALGEWLSVQSSRELYQRQIEIEKAEIATAPEEEVDELALIYQSRGLEQEQARNIARQLMADKESAIQTLSREELGIDPGELGGSAWVAGATSFALFAVGAIIPVIPFTFLHGRGAVFGSAALSTAGLFGIGTATTLFTGQSVLRSGMRMVLTGLAAAGITFGIGRLVGVSIGG